MATLENLYYGNIAPHEKYIRKGSKVDKLVSALCSEEESLVSTFSQQQKATFDRFRKCQDELNSITELTAFSDGFKLAAKLLIEVLQEQE